MIDYKPFRKRQISNIERVSPTTPASNFPCTAFGPSLLAYIRIFVKRLPIHINVLFCFQYLRKYQKIANFFIENSENTCYLKKTVSVSNENDSKAAEDNIYDMKNISPNLM